MDVKTRFNIHLAVFAFLCYIYFTKEPLLPPYWTQVIAALLAASLFYATVLQGEDDGENLAEGGSTDVLETDTLQEESEVEEDNTYTGSSTDFTPDQIADKWFQGASTSAFVPATGASVPERQDFWGSLLEAPLSRRGGALCTRSYSSYNPNHNNI